MEDMTIDTNDSFADFAAAFDDTDGYQTDDPGKAEESETVETATDDAGSEAQDEPEGGESDGAEIDQGSETEGTDNSADGGTPEGEQSFTIRVNKQDVTLSREDMITYAQKGADYDRVKGQLTESRQTTQNLQERLDKYQEAMDVLEAVSKDSGIPMEALVEQIQVNMLTKQGKTEAEAKAEIRAQKAERERDALKAQAAEQQKPADDTKARMTRELAEFRKHYPKVDLTEELCKELMADVQGGMPLINAYQKHEDARKEAQIAELQRQLAAEKQNKRNRASTPGSQNDSGGRRVKSDFDIFAEAFD